MRRLQFYVFITLLCFNIDSSHGLRILGLFPLQMNSMNVICEELMKGLAIKGHQVDVYSHFPPKKPIPNFTHFNLLGSLPALSNNISFDEVSNGYLPEFIKFWLQNYGKSLCNLLEHQHFQNLINNPPNDPPYDLVIIELSVAFCYLAFGRYLNIPLISIVNSALPEYSFEPFGTPLNPAVDTSVFLPYTTPMTFLERLHNVITIKTLTYTFNHYVREQNVQVEKFFGPGYPDVVDMQKDVSLVLLNHDSSLYGNKPFAPIIVPISGLHVADRNEKLPKVVQKWLDDSFHGCIYFSFGSMTRIETFPKNVIEVFYKSFENIAPVRVLMKIAKPEKLPPGLPSNVITYHWLPQIKVLKHKNVKAFVTHGGLMGTQEAIYCGVPMVGVPIFFDQHFNINSYVERKIAINVNYTEITEEIFTNALEEILNNPAYREAVIKIRDKSKDRPMSPMDTAAFWIEYVHRHGPDSLKSPIANMPWWQASLLDVYAFIIISIITAAYLIIKITKMTINFLRPGVIRQPKSKVKRN